MKVNFISLSPSSLLTVYHAKSSLCAFWQGQLLDMSYSQTVQQVCQSVWPPFSVTVHTVSSLLVLYSLADVLYPSVGCDLLLGFVFWFFWLSGVFFGCVFVVWFGLFSEFRKLNSDLFSWCSFALVTNLVHLRESIEFSWSSLYLLNQCPPSTLRHCFYSLKCLSSFFTSVSNSSCVFL